MESIIAADAKTMRTGTVRPCTTRACIKCKDNASKSVVYFPNYYNGAPMCERHFYEYVDALGDAIVGVSWRNSFPDIDWTGGP